VKSVLLCCLLFLAIVARTQPLVFPIIGQLPENAYPVCGLDTFRQLILPYGNGRPIDIPGCGRLETPNPYYYSFTCYSSGNLAILLEPVNPQQDLNWELFDITGHPPDEIYTNSSLQVIGNWSGTPGRTGASSSGVSSTKCLSNPIAQDHTFSTMPSLIQGHHYLLLVCDYSKTQSDYFLSFAGSTAVITNPQKPQLQSAYIGCNKKIINLVMNRLMRCNSLHEDGSQFSINSPLVRITGVSGMHCSEQFDFDTIQLTLSDTLVPGNYTVTVKAAGNGTLLWDDCLDEIAPGGQVAFTVVPSENVTAAFSYDVGYGCKTDTLFFKTPSAQNGNSSLWYINSLFASTAPAPVIPVGDSGTLQVLHIVTGGFCADSLTRTIVLDNFLKAGFLSPSGVCPNDLAGFSDTSIGNIVSWNWNFGDGTSDSQQEPPAHLYPDGPEKKYAVTLIVKNNLGCQDTATATLTKLQSCTIAVPNAFTPNGDGKNDFLYPLNAFSARDPEFLVYNRYGQLVFKTHDPNGKWDGRINGISQPTGLYSWTFAYTDGTSTKRVFLHGTSLLIR
jgi:gliding motility-associated-like protein